MLLNEELRRSTQEAERRVGCSVGEISNDRHWLHCVLVVEIGQTVPRPFFENGSRVTDWLNEKCHAFYVMCAQLIDREILELPRVGTLAPRFQREFPRGHNHMRKCLARGERLCRLRLCRLRAT